MGVNKIMKAKKMLSIILAASLMTASLIGCGGTKTEEKDKSGGSSQQITLKVWAPQEDQKPSDGYPNGIVPFLCDKFNKDHPEWNIKFQYGVCSEGEAATTALKDLDAAADVFMYSNDEISKFVEAGAIAKLGGKTLDNMNANIDKTMMNSVTYNGGVYGVPYTSNTYFMYYDKSKYTEDEVKSLDTMMKKDLGDGVYNFSYQIGTAFYLPAFYYAAGGELFGPNGDKNDAGTTFGERVDATNYLIDLQANPKFLSEGDDTSTSKTKFKEGKLGAFVSGAWDAADVKAALGDNFGVTILPTVNIGGVDKQLYSFAGSKAVGVNPTCKNMEQAVALAAYLGGEEAQKIRFDVRGYAPTWKSVEDLDAVKKDVVISTQVKEINEASKVQPLVKNMDKFWQSADALGKSIKQGDVKKSNAEEATKKFADAINK